MQQPNFVRLVYSVGRKLDREFRVSEVFDENASMIVKDIFD